MKPHATKTKVGTSKDHPLWTPPAGLKCIFQAPLGGRKQHAQITRVNRLGKEMLVYYRSALTGAQLEAARQILPHCEPQWAAVESQVSLTHWRRVVSQVQVLPDDWEPSEPVDTMQVNRRNLATVVQSLLGQLDAESAEALLKAIDPFV